MNSKNLPTDLRIQSPCPKTWEELEGDKRRRFCSECQLHVHNSAELTVVEAGALLEGALGRVCMRVVTDAAGEAQFKTKIDGEAGGWRRLVGLALAAGTSLLAACRDDTPRATVGEPTTGGIPAATTTATGGHEFGQELGDVLGPQGCEEEPEGQALMGELAPVVAPKGQVVMGRVAPEPRAMLGSVAPLEHTLEELETESEREPER